MKIGYFPHCVGSWPVYMLQVATLTRPLVSNRITKVNRMSPHLKAIEHFFLFRFSAKHHVHILISRLFHSVQTFRSSKNL